MWLHGGAWMLGDCAAALDFLTTHAGEYGLDPARMAVMGESAGGHSGTLLAGGRGPRRPVRAGRGRWSSWTAERRGLMVEFLGKTPAGQM